MQGPRDAHRQGTRLLSLVLIALGIAIVVRTVTAGGGALATGVVIGVLFAAAGGARLYLQQRGRV